MPSARITFALAVTLSLAGCARGNPLSQRTTITSASMESGYREAEAAAADVTVGKYVEALARADNAVRLAPTNPWALYNRAAALHHLGRAEAAAAAYRSAEARFGDDRWGRSLAIYGRARVLDDVGQCDEAKRAYEQFAALVGSTDPEGAKMALEYGAQCRAPSPPPSPSDPVVTEMTRALGTGDFARVLALREKAVGTGAPTPWVDYNVGAALAGLGRFDEAAAAFERAANAFGERDRWARSVAVWGRARALASGGQCAAARAAVEEYTRLVGATAPHDVRLALAYEGDCK